MIIGLTGGIGSGKSTVAKLLKVMGIAVYDSDASAKAMYLLPEVKPQIINLLGQEAYLDAENINREFISNKIFGNKVLLEKINAIIHPEVEKDFKRFCEMNKQNKFIVKETALLFETGINKKVDKVILITAPVSVRVKRVMERDNTSEAEIMSRMNNQIADEQKIPYSDFVIYNNEEAPLIPQVVNMVEQLKNA